MEQKMRENGKFYYAVVDDTEERNIVAIADTPEELAELTGVKIITVLSALSRIKHGAYKNSKYVKIPRMRDTQKKYCLKYWKLYDRIMEQYGSVSKFAKECCVSRSYMHKLLNGTRTPNKPLIDIILKAINMTYEDAFNDY